MKINVDGHIIETSKINAITEIYYGLDMFFYIVLNIKEICISERLNLDDNIDEHEKRFRERRQAIIDVWNEERKDIPKY